MPSRRSSTDDRERDPLGTIDIDALLTAPRLDARAGLDPRLDDCPDGPGHDHVDRPARPAGRGSACFDHGHRRERGAGRGADHHERRRVGRIRRRRARAPAPVPSTAAPTSGASPPSAASSPSVRGPVRAPPTRRCGPPSGPTTSTCRGPRPRRRSPSPRASAARRRRPRPGSARRTRPRPRPTTSRRRRATGSRRSTTSTTRPARPPPPRPASAAAATKVGATLERLALEADAARIAAETAEAACLMARQALAVCDERVDAGRGARPQPPRCRRRGRSGPGVAVEDDEPLAAALGTGGTPTIFRLLRGDRDRDDPARRAARRDDPAEQRRWQAQHRPDWSTRSSRSPSRRRRWSSRPTTRSGAPFTLDAGPRHRRGPVVARLPVRRAVAAGSTSASRPSATCRSPSATPGLDPMRIRQWPTEAEMAALFADVSVAADEHLAGAAGDLTPGRAGRDARPPRRRRSPSSGTTGAASGPLLLEGA